MQIAACLLSARQACGGVRTCRVGVLGKEAMEHLVSGWNVPWLPLCHLWYEAQLILALLYELLQLHGELLFHLLVAGSGIHSLQPAHQ